VVDNGSRDNVEAVITKCSVARMVREPQPGSYAARNKGIAESEGVILAFTDSDCIPAADWIERGVARLLSTPKGGLVGGRIELFFQNPERPTGVEKYQTLTAFPQQTYVEKEHFAATANVFTWRRIVDDIGVFNDQLKSGGDREWGCRVYAAGYDQVYADEVRVDHPARGTLRELAMKSARCTRSEPGRATHDAFRSLISYFLPRVGFVLKAVKEKKIHGVIQPLQFLYIYWVLRTVVLWERFRQLLGGEPRR